MSSVLSPLGISPESLDAYEAITQAPKQLVDAGYRGYLQSQGLKMQGDETVGDLAQNAIDPEGKSLIPFRTLADAASDPLTWAGAVGPAKVIGEVGRGIPNKIYKPLASAFPWIDQIDQAKIGMKALLQGAPPPTQRTFAGPLKGGKGFTINPPIDKLSRKQSYKSGVHNKSWSIGDDRDKSEIDLLIDLLGGPNGILPVIKETVEKPKWVGKQFTIRHGPTGKKFDPEYAASKR
jgi:hypothetical protein